jgi:hypothetical protein
MESANQSLELNTSIYDVTARSPKGRSETRLRDVSLMPTNYQQFGHFSSDIHCMEVTETQRRG